MLTNFEKSYIIILTQKFKMSIERISNFLIGVENERSGVRTYSWTPKGVKIYVYKGTKRT